MEKITIGAHIKPMETRRLPTVGLTRASTIDVNPIVEVPVNDVMVADNRQRSEPDPMAVERVRQSIVDVGLLMPIGVTPHRVLIFGATRLAAVKLLGWETIDAREFESAEDPDVRALMEWEENDARSDLSLEQQLAYKRSVVDPILTARAQARHEATLFPRITGGGKFPPPVGSDDSELTASCVERGKVRDLVGKYLQTSGKTMEKYEKLADLSEDTSLPGELRAEARMAREKANTLGRVDGEFKRVMALLEQSGERHRSHLAIDAECEQRFVRAYSGFERHLERFEPTKVGPVLTEGSMSGFRFVLDKACRWLRSAEKARDA